jgi:hypothetical protein
VNHQPLTYRRVGYTLVPRQKWQFDRQFVDGHDYDLIEHEERSSASHTHYFATVNEAWKTLPESQSRRWADATHMRKWFLIKTGWSVDRTICAETEQGAKEIAALAGQLDPSAVIIIQGSVVTVSVARTQKGGRGGMNKEDFQTSKQAVLEEIAAVLGVDVATLSSQVSHSSGGSQPADRTDTPAAGGPHIDPAAGVSNSNSSGGPADTPAVKDPDTPHAAGANPSEASLLSDDWREVYINTMANPTTRAMAIQTRDTTALQMIGGKPNATEREWMRQVATLTNKRDKGKLNPGEYAVELDKLKSQQIGAQDAA